MQQPIIEIENLMKDYITGTIITKVLRGLTFTINKGEFVSIMGPSGSGKSTLMNIIGFLDQPTEGIYRLEGGNTEALQEDDLAFIRNNKIGFVFQTFNLLPRTTALDNVRMPLMYAGVRHGEQIERATKALEKVGLGHRLHHNPNELSGGEQQRVAIARALINNPILILADEPTGNLDAESTNDIIGFFQDLNKAGNTIVMVTHERDIAKFTKRVIHLDYGKIKSDSSNGKQNLVENGDKVVANGVKQEKVAELKVD